jgi:hypothetical protein
MSTTPTTTERPARAPYTVLGGARRDRVRRYTSSLAFVVLARGDRLFRAELLRDLASRRLGEILWIEGHEPSADLETLAHDFPDVRFILLKASCSTGERVSIGIAEAAAPLVFVLWSDTRLGVVAPELPALLEKSAALCTVPAARNARHESIPTWQSPQWKRRRLAIAYHVPRRDGERTLFPFDYCGIYNREKYAQSGGYDPAVGSPYWQKLDFGMRSVLWGERVEGSTGLTLSYTGTPPEDDATPDAGYKLFWLKNAAVRVTADSGHLPAWRALEYVLRSGSGPLVALREFRQVRAWVRTHRYRFRRDARDTVEHWERS